MMKSVVLVIFMLAAVAYSSYVDVIPHYSKHGHGHGISTRYFVKAQGHGYGGYGLGYGGYGQGYGSYGGYGLGGYGGYGGYGLGGYGGYGAGYGDSLGYGGYW
ncbi:neuropeptide-like protein 31 [Stegodyphus dumicola]|uniref:neuropeptide-like protein 31 n=1 Tax=Stegodyphus dumicola TaxID=202533 RepID=UPI0015B29EC9|nr:neuropeptide-like protein 31 [Stegodyphus dumicola]